MRNTTSILSLLLALGIYGAGPIVTKSGPFAATAAHADGGDSGDGGGDDSGDGGDDSGDDSSDDSDDDSSDDNSTDDSSDDDDNDEDINVLCVADCNEN